MVYLNQAATSYPKPQKVIDAVRDAILNPPQGQFRSSNASGDIFASCKKNLSVLFGIQDMDCIYFTSGATHAANALIYGLGFKNSRVVVSQTEHNSILRPTMNLKEQIKEALVCPCDEVGRLDLDALDKLLSNNEVSAVFINHCSNVTGFIQDMENIGKLVHSHGALFVADYSQSAGCIPIQSDTWGVDAFIFAGHKALFGQQGIGGLYVRNGLDFRPFMYGGTGRNSKQLVYDEDYEYEVGTQNGPGIASLDAGVKYILSQGVNTIREHDMFLMHELYSGLREIKGLKLFEVPEDLRGPVLSFTMDKIKPADIAYILSNAYDITVRTGLHCAPLIHEAMGTSIDGTVRVSVSSMNTIQDVQALIDAIKDIEAGLN